MLPTPPATPPATSPSTAMDAQSILIAAQQLNNPIRVTGTTPSAQAFLVARYAQMQNRKGPVVVLCPNDDLASSFSTDLECFTRSAFRLPFRIFHFPSWDQSPYSPIRPSLRTRLTRLSCLSPLSQGSFENDFIVTTLAASFQSTIPQSFFKEMSLSIRHGESVNSRETLISRLLESGYLRIDPVEDPGTFAVRGEIIDVFPTDRSSPIRIELLETK